MINYFIITDIHIERRTFIKKNRSCKGLKITGTFLDEISHDIPHQNWGEKEWDADFRHMKSIGIDGKKAIMGTGKLTNDQAVSVAEHETNCGTGRHHTRQAQRTTLPTI